MTTIRRSVISLVEWELRQAQPYKPLGIASVSEAVSSPQAPNGTRKDCLSSRRFSAGITAGSFCSGWQVGTKVHNNAKLGRGIRYSTPRT